MTQSRAAVVVSSGVEYVLRSSEVACEKLYFELCDGTSTWTGALAPEQLTPSATALSDFRSQLLKSLVAVALLVRFFRHYFCLRVCHCVVLLLSRWR